MKMEQYAEKIEVVKAVLDRVSDRAITQLLCAGIELLVERKVFTIDQMRAIGEVVAAAPDMNVTVILSRK